MKKIFTLSLLFATIHNVFGVVSGCTTLFTDNFVDNSAWTITSGNLLTSSNIATTEGVSSMTLAYANLSQPLAANEVLTLTFNSNTVTNFATNGWAGISLYTGGSSGTEQIFIGSPGNVSSWGIDGAALSSSIAFSETSSVAGVVFTYNFDNGNWTLTVNGEVQSGTIASNLAFDAIRIGSDVNDNADIAVSNLYVGTAPVIASIASSTNVSCNGGSDGAAAVNTATNYTYMWSGASETTASVSGLTAKVYSVTVSEGYCSQVALVTISEPSAISPTLTCNQTSGTGASDGSSSISVSGGTSGYSYDWGSGSTTVTSMTGLSAGVVSVTVTDANNCTANVSCTVIDNPCSSITISATSNDISCNGLNDGDATATMTGGSSTTFTYLWSNASTSSTATGLMASTYVVTVTDGNSCTGTATVTISEPSALSITVSSTNSSCGDGSDGTGTVMATGGPSSSYGYSWSNSDNSASTSGLSVGTYSVTVTSGSCSASGSITISAPSTYAITVDTTICEGTTYFAGGANQDSTGTFVDSLTTISGCDSVITTNLTVTPLPLAMASVIDSILCAGDTTSLSAGVSNATYLWNNASILDDNTIEKPVATPTSSGTITFTVTVTSNNCSATSSVSVEVEPTPTLSVSENINSSDCTDTLTVTSSASSFFWVTPYGTQTTSSTEVVALITDVSQTYTVTAIDTTGCNSQPVTFVIAGNSSCLPIGIKEESSSSSFEIFPNPNNGNFTVNITELNTNITLKVMDVTGKTVLSKRLASASTNIQLNVTSGIYFVKINNNGITQVEKVIVK